MEPINIKETMKIPVIRYDYDNHNIEIKGKSIPEDPREFFTPVLQWF